ncbi:MarR family winged helix-turn-helix transcriptional regulator [Antarctobacter sp.]|uniref:MarR family winged helix-turn-helix transcriptional regulator n=1 Tax=Antarctobacter sp. TaxID=1872577 RepID=UPI003A946A1D
MPGHLIRRLQQLSSSIFAEQMRAVGSDLTSPQFAALTMLQEHPGIDQATLAGLIAHDRATIGGVIERLCAKGLIERRTNLTDRRAKVLALTPEGEKRIAYIRPIVETMQKNLLVGLTETEKAEFIRLAAKVAAAGNDRTRAPLRLPKDKPESPAH